MFKVQMRGWEEGAEANWGGGGGHLQIVSTTEIKKIKKSKSECLEMKPNPRWDFFLCPLGTARASSSYIVIEV